MNSSKNIYVISIGLFESKKVYLDNPRLYKTVPTTTKNILYAKWFEDEEEAEKYASKYFGANVEEYKIVPLHENLEEENDEIAMLKAANIELQRQIKELKSQLGK